jgi:hypothetical protein
MGKAERNIKVGDYTGRVYASLPVLLIKIIDINQIYEMDVDRN